MSGTGYFFLAGGLVMYMALILGQMARVWRALRWLREL